MLTWPLLLPDAGLNREEKPSRTPPISDQEAGLPGAHYHKPAAVVLAEPKKAGNAAGNAAQKEAEV